MDAARLLKGDYKSLGVTVAVSAVKDHGQFGSCRAFAAHDGLFG